jgi:hypothetical protein
MKYDLSIAWKWVSISVVWVLGRSAHHRSSAYDQTCAWLWVIKNVMGALLWALEIIFEVQRKRSNEKITRRKISLPTYKTCFFFPLIIGTLLLSNLITFLFFIHFKRFKVLQCTIWSSTNHLGTLITTKQHTRNLFWCLRISFVMFGGLFFWILNPLYFGGP